MTPAIVADGVRKRYTGAAQDAVGGVTFTIPAGAAVGLLGPNGAGKSTLLKLICGATKPTAGTLWLNAKDPAGAQAKRDLAVVHQSSPFDMMLPVRENLRIAAGFRGLPWRHARARATHLLEEFGLAGKADQLVFTLSGGQRRRLQVVRALLRIPRLLLLDEPSAGMDVEGRRSVWAMLAELRREHGVTIVWTSHYLEELERNCERVLVLNRGALIRDASPDRLISDFGQVVAQLRLPAAADLPALLSSARALGLRADATGQLAVVSGDDVRVRVPALLTEAAARGVHVDGVEFRPASLEDVFVSLTRKEGVPG